MGLLAELRRVPTTCWTRRYSVRPPGGAVFSFHAWIVSVLLGAALLGQSYRSGTALLGLGPLRRGNPDNTPSNSRGEFTGKTLEATNGVGGQKGIAL